MLKFLLKKAAGFVACGLMLGMAMAPANAVEWSWNGYWSWNYSADSRSNTRSTFDQFALALIPRVSINDRIDLYSSVVFEHAPYFEVDGAVGSRTLNNRSTGELTLNDAYLTYHVNDLLNLRAGKWANPFGLWNTAQYADPTYPTVKQPGRDTFYSRASTPRQDSEFFQRYGMGFWTLGRWNVLSYDLYVVNGRTAGSGQHVDDNDNKGFGGRLKFDIPVPGFKKSSIMYSGYTDIASTATFSTTFEKNKTNAVSMELALKNVDFHAEYANGTRGPKHLEAFHAMLRYLLMERLTPFVRYEVLEPNRRAGQDRTFIKGGGVQINLLPGQMNTATLKLHADRVTSENTAKALNYNRYFVGVGAGF